MSWLDTVLAPVRPYKHGVENQKADAAGEVACPCCGGGRVMVCGFGVEPRYSGPIRRVREITVSDVSCQCDLIKVYGRLSGKDLAVLMGKATGRGAGNPPSAGDDRLWL